MFFFSSEDMLSTIFFNTEKTLLKYCKKNCFKNKGRDKCFSELSKIPGKLASKILIPYGCIGFF